MSNARSPRDVCSTTMGTRGLIGGRVYRSGWSPLRRLPGVQSSPGFWGPACPLAAVAASRSLSGVQIASRASAWASRDRLRLLGDQVGGLAQAQLLAQQRVAAASRRRSRIFSGASLPSPGPSASIRSSSEASIALGLGHRGQGRLAPQRLLGVGLTVADQLLARLPLHLKNASGRSRAAERALDPLPASRGRARGQDLRGSSIFACSAAASPRPPRNSASARCSAAGGASSRISSRSSSSVSNSDASAAKSSSSSGRSFSRTSLTLTAKVALLPARSSAR